MDPSNSSQVAQLVQTTPLDIFLMLGDTMSIKSAASIFPRIATGALSCAIPTYVVDGGQLGEALTDPYPNGRYLGGNITMLPPRGRAVLGGVNIGWLAGCVVQHTTLQPIKLTKQQLNQITVLREIGQSVVQRNDDATHSSELDILLTTSWPHALHSNQFCLNRQNLSVLSTGMSISHCPRYHIVSGCKDYFRLPAFTNRLGKVSTIMGVASVDSQAIAPPKTKYLVALEVGKGQQQPAMPNPLNEWISYQTYQKSQQESKFEYESKFRAGIDDRKSYGKNENHRLGQRQSSKYNRNKTQKNSKDSSRQCWFCIPSPSQLSNENSQTQNTLIRLKHCYVYADPGPIQSGQLQVVPFRHIEGVSNLNPEQREELESVVRNIMSNMNISTNADSKSKGGYAAYIYRPPNTTTSFHHLSIQILPVSKAVDLVETIRERNAEQQWGLMDRDADSEWVLPSQQDKEGQLRIWADTTQFIKSQSSFSAKGEGKHDDQQKGQIYPFTPRLPREIICSVLGCPERIDWRRCALKEGQVQSLKDQVRKWFK